MTDTIRTADLIATLARRAARADRMLNGYSDIADDPHTLPIERDRANRNARRALAKYTEVHAIARALGVSDAVADAENEVA